MQRYISESLYIESSTKEKHEKHEKHEKSEWGRQKLTRIKIVDNTWGVGYNWTSSSYNFISIFVGKESPNVYSEESSRIRCPQKN